jgi:hypothetical protein
MKFGFINSDEIGIDWIGVVKAEEQNQFQTVFVEISVHRI